MAGVADPQGRIRRCGRAPHVRVSGRAAPRSALSRRTEEFLPARDRRDASRPADRRAARSRHRSLPIPRQGAAHSLGACSHDPAALRRRDWNQTDLWTIWRGQRPAHRNGCAPGGLDVRLVRRKSILGRRDRRGVEPVSPHLAQRHRRPRQRRSGHGGGRRQSRLHRPAPLLADNIAAHQARPVCRFHDRLHLDLHRARSAAHLRLQQGHIGADLSGAEGSRRQSVPLRPRLHHARELRGALCRGQGAFWTRKPCDDGPAGRRRRPQIAYPAAGLGMHRFHFAG